MIWFKVTLIIFANAILAYILMRWSGKEGKEFRKQIRNSR